MNEQVEPILDETDGQPSVDIDIRTAVDSLNLADNLDEELLNKISSQCSEGFEYDIESRSDWEANLNEWTKLALQVREEKTWPWPKASNVKYPMLSTASMQFSARAYPSLVPSTGNLVKVEVIGKDLTGQKLEKATRVGKFMSYQLLNEMEGWEEDMDKLLMILPIAGTIFKKTYYSSTKKRNCSELVLPKNLVVNYWAKCLSEAERVSEIIEMTPRVVKARMKAGLFRDVELGEPSTQHLETEPNGAYGKQDGTIPYQIVEQHTWYDLDDDGLDEPYIITFERVSGEILRIQARFDDTNIEENDNGEIVNITPIEYYTKFSFIPNPDGGFYDIGFGLLLAPLNESVNTLINQLIDSGTLNNLQGGFLGKGLKLKMGESKFTPGEWKTINSTADDLKKQVLPLPTKEPSAVLFQLMGTLVTSGKELASVAEIFTGKMPGQNTPATTTMATVEQGMKVFTAVYKRIYRALKEEFKKLYLLNGIYYDEEKYVQVLDQPVGLADFNNDSYDICPGADPATATQSEKLMKAQGLLELVALAPGALDPIKVLSRVLEAQEQPNWEDLFTEEVKMSGQIPSQPDPKMLEMQMKSQMEQQKIQMQAAAQQQKMQLETVSKQAQLAMEAESHQQEMQHKAQMAQVEGSLALHKQRIFEAEGRQKLMQNEETHQQSLKQSEEMNKSKIQQQKNSTKTGSGTPSARPSSKSSGQGKKP